MRAAMSAPSTIPPENEFFDSEPRYSTVSELPIAPPPRPVPSLSRLILSRVLFLAILGAVLAPLVYKATTLGWVRCWAVFTSLFGG